MSNTINSNSLAQLNLLQQQRNVSSANNQTADNTVTSQQLNNLQQTLTQSNSGTALTQSQQDSLNNLKNSLSTLPPTTQASVLQALINSASNDVSSYLTDKNLDSADITQGKNMIESLNLANETLGDTQTNGIVNNSLYVNNGIGNNGLGITATNNGLPVITFDNANELLASNLFNNCDPIMKSAMILLLFVNTTMANTMNNYDNQYISLKNNMDTLTNAQNYMQQVTGYMAANPTANINVFAALAYAENPNDPNLNDIGINPDNEAQYQQFIQSCPQFMAAFKASFQKYQDGGGTESADQLALGDGTYTSILNPGGGPQTFSGQSQVMQYFTQPYNQAGYNISGLGSNPVFSNSWTDSTLANATNSPYTNSSSSSNSLPGVQGNALTFNTSTVSSMIGSSGGTQNSTTNVLGAINQAMTTATTSNNTLQAQINAISNSINVIYNTVGGNLIPNTKIQF